MLYNTSIFYEMILVFYFIYGQLHLSQGRNSYFMDWEVFCLYCDTFLTEYFNRISIPQEVSDCFPSDGEQFAKWQYFP